MFVCVFVRACVHVCVRACVCVCVCPSYMAALDQCCNCKPWAAADQVDQGQDEVVIREGWGIVMVRRVISHGLGRVWGEESIKFEAA